LTQVSSVFLYQLVLPTNTPQGTEFVGDDAPKHYISGKTVVARLTGLEPATPGVTGPKDVRGF